MTPYESYMRKQAADWPSIMNAVSDVAHHPAVRQGATYLSHMGGLLDYTGSDVLAYAKARAGVLADKLPRLGTPAPKNPLGPGFRFANPGR